MSDVEFDLARQAQGGDGDMQREERWASGQGVGQREGDGDGAAVGRDGWEALRGGGRTSLHTWSGGGG